MGLKWDKLNGSATKSKVVFIITGNIFVYILEVPVWGLLVKALRKVRILLWGMGSVQMGWKLLLFIFFIHIAGVISATIYIWFPHPFFFYSYLSRNICIISLFRQEYDVWYNSVFNSGHMTIHCFFRFFYLLGNMVK